MYISDWINIRPFKSVLNFWLNKHHWSCVDWSVRFVYLNTAIWLNSLQNVWQFSFGLRSGLWLGQSRTLILLASSHFSVAFTARSHSSLAERIRCDLQYSPIFCRWEMSTYRWIILIGTVHTHCLFSKADIFCLRINPTWEFSQNITNPLFISKFVILTTKILISLIKKRSNIFHFFSSIVLCKLCV